MIAALRRALARLASLFTRSADDRELDEELELHLAALEAEHLRRGASGEEARRLARQELGNLTELREAHRATRGVPLLDSLWRDLRAAVRSLRRDAALTTSALLIVGLGIGASVTVFSVVDALLIRPLPFADADRLVWIANGESDNLSAQTTQVRNLQELREAARSFDDIAGFSPFYGVGDVRLTGDDAPERVTLVPVTAGFFPLLGVRPTEGRFFTADEARWGAPRTVVLSHGFWQRRYNGDPAVVGRGIVLDGEAATIAGVLPPTFDFAATFTPGRPADLFEPFPLAPETNRRGNTLALIGRLASGATLEQAAAEAKAIAGRFPVGREGDHRRNKLDPNLSPLRIRVAGAFRFGIGVVAAAVGFLLLLICANVSNLLLAKGATRRREMAVRAALGAGRGRLIRQLLVEGAVLATGGALLGIAVATLAIGMIGSLQGTAIPLLQDVRLDRSALLFAVLATAVTALGTGLLPALQISTTSPQAALADGGRGSTRAGGRLRRALVMTEMAVVCVMLTGAGLLTRSLINVLRVQPGFDPSGVVTVRVDPDASYRTVAEQVAYFDALLEQVLAVPGVETAGLTDALPFGNNFGWRRWNADLPGQEQEDGPKPLVRLIDGDYFHAMRLSLLTGRAFTRADDATAEPVVIVNEPLAQLLWPGRDAVGQRLRSSGVIRQVVGVVSEARYFSLEQASGPEMYFPMRQSPHFQVIDLVVRTPEGASTIAPALMTALGRVDRNLPAMTVRTLTRLMDDTLFTRRSIALLVVGFACFGLLLASLGLYAVIAYAVAQRRQEIGVRMALGATPGAVRRQVLRETLALAAAGMAVGIPAAWLTSKAIRGLLFGVTPTDPLTAVAVLSALVVVAALAGLIPARHAARVDPISALQSG
ncbi:MAG: ABC transporter permease [Gemmatimonadales bacterium]